MSAEQQKHGCLGIHSEVDGLGLTTRISTLIVLMPDIRLESYRASLEIC